MLVDYGRDDLLTHFGRATLKDRYLMPGENSCQDLFARVAKAYGNDEAHSQRIYDYMSRLWFMPATPILSNGGTTRGLPISCFLSEASDDMEGIVGNWTENIWLACRGGGIGSYWGNVRGVGERVGAVGKSSGIIPFIKVQDSFTLAISQGCVDGETEILTEQGWVKFSDLSDKHGKVAQVNDDFCIEFVTVSEYHKYNYEGIMHHYTNEGETADHFVTPNHRMMIETLLKSGGTRKFSGKFKEVLSEDFKPHRDNRVYTTGASTVRQGSELSWLERFFIAYQADGSTKPAGCSNGNTNNCLAYNFHFSKERKIIRFREILSYLDFYYSEKVRLDGTTTFYVSVPKEIQCLKDFSWVDIANVNSNWARQFIEEVSHWDGHNNELHTIRYDNIIKSAVDSVSIIACLAGYKVMVEEMLRPEPRRSLYTAHIHTGRNTIGGESLVKNNVPFSGLVYCVTVPSGRFVSRRNGKTLVTGNSLRRGSAAVYLPVWHPEIEEFIEVRRPTGGDPNRRSLNLHNGIVLDDAFMTAVEEDGTYDLRAIKDGVVVKTIRARDLWIRILTARIETGEPYLLFIDTVVEQMPAHQKRLGLKVKTSNLCSEITLPTGKDHLGHQRTAVCCLSSLNLELYDEWKNDGQFILDVMYFLDNVLEDFIRNAPATHTNAAYAAARERSVGLGVMGLHSYFQKKGFAWESLGAEIINKAVFTNIKQQVDAANTAIGIERGANLDALEAGEKNRFSCTMAIAPTASISVICGGASPGIEPNVANTYNHKTLSGNFPVRNKYLAQVLQTYGMDNEETWSSIANNEGSVQHLKFLTDREKDVFKTAYELDQMSVVNLAADRAKMIDQSQSVNLFLPADVHKRTLHALHFQAWKKGLKSLYYCRSRSIRRAEKPSQMVERKAIAECEGGVCAVPIKQPEYDECQACQ